MRYRCMCLPSKMMSHYLLFPYSLQFYLPNESTINKDFLKAVLSGQKQLMKKDDVKEITVPKYDELSVQALYPQFAKDP